MKRRWLCAALVIPLALAAAGAAWAAKKASSDAAARHPRPLLIAHYMTWFGRPEKSGNWFQWKQTLPNVPADKHHNPDLILPNGRRDVAAIHYPSIGPYDSSDPLALQYHILLAKDAGIDAFMVNWYGFEGAEAQRRQEDRGFEELLKLAESLNFKVCINYEDKSAFPPYQKVNSRAAAVAHASKTIARAMEKYAKSPAYLRIDGKPVLSNFGHAYATDPNALEQVSFMPAEWKQILASAKGKVYFMHDHQWDWRKNIQEAGFLPVSDTIYSWIGRKSDRTSFLEESQALKKAGKLDRVMTLANPGFDNTPCWGWGGGLSQIPRRAGQEYRDHFEEAAQHQADIIQIATWNDFTEGSTIEPTEEYGDFYLKLTAEYANGWTPNKPYGKALDIPKRIHDARARWQRLEASRRVPPAALAAVRDNTDRATAAFLARDRAQAESFLKAAETAAASGEKLLPAVKRITAALTPAESDAFAGETLTLNLTVRNPYGETVPLYIELDRINIPRAWVSGQEKTVWAKPDEEVQVPFTVTIPADAPELVGGFTATIDSPYLPVTSNVVHLNVSRIRLRADVGPVNILTANKEEKLQLTVETRQKETSPVDISFNVPAGWIVSPKKAAKTLPKNGALSVPFTLRIPDAKPGVLTVVLRTGGVERKIEEPLAAVASGKTALLSGDINQDGVKDFVLANGQIEVQATPAIGGRILALIHRASGRNQLFTDYPRVARTEGDTWDKWAEYGGINEWFPGDWPGAVWNNDWDVRNVQNTGTRASVVFYSKTKDDMTIQREMSVDAQRPALTVRYQIENAGKAARDVVWTNHPDFAPGGEAGFEDAIIVPAAEGKPGSVAKTTYFPRLQKTHYTLREGWMLAHDGKSEEYVGQRFDPSLVEKVGVWEGKNFFTMEQIFKKMQMKPAEKKSFQTEYLVGQGPLNKAIERMKAPPPKAQP